jgi:hypothetical protein
MAKRVLDSLPRAKGAGKLPPGPRKKPRPVPIGMRYIISGKVVEEIRKLILAWPHPTMTWESVRSAVNTKFKAEWTRQALSNHAPILKAFQVTKNRLRGERDASPKRRKTLTRDSTVPVLQGRIRFLEDRVLELEGEIHEYRTQFLRIQQNAYLLGVSMPKLMKSTEPGDRGRSDK